MRNITFLKNNYYLLSNSGAFGSKIFIDEEDRVRFLFLILYLQSPAIINNTDWYTASFVRRRRFGLNKQTLEKILKHRQVELVSFRISDSDFSLIVHNMEDHIISVFMQRVLTGYSKYFNSKYKKRGHVFAGPYKAVQIKKSELKEEIKKMHQDTTTEDDRFSSKKDYSTNNKTDRWNKLLIIYTK